VSDRIKLAIDARLLNGNFVGVSRYIYEMSHELQKYNIELYFLSNKPIILSQELVSNRITIIEDTKYSWLPGSIWMQLRVNYLCLNNNIGVFWGTQIILPFIKSVKIKYVLTVYDLVFRLYPSSMQMSGRIFSALFFKQSLKNADKIITISDNTKNELLHFYSTLKLDPKVQTIYLGKRDLEANNQEKILYDFDYILALGSIEPRKNLLYLIKTFEYMLIKKPTLKLVLAGGKGWKSSGLFEYIKENKLQNNIIFTGYVSDQDINMLFKKCELFVFPSMYEGFGLPLIEAEGKCLIACSSINVFKELEYYFDNLLLVDFLTDPFESAKILESILEENKHKTSKIKREYKYLFEWNNAAEKFIKLVGELH
jgi:glycosyltransferase involved in cell wall biosynthesis